jgi:hypothetical protein
LIFSDRTQETHMPPNRTFSSNGGGNLFLEADPDASPAPAKSHHPQGGTRARRQSARGPRLIVPVDASSPNGAAANDHPDYAAFTRPAKRPAALPAKAREYLRRADANARRLVAQLAARPYRALLALALVGATLLALSWMGLALRNAAAARHNSNRRAAAATRALNRERESAANALQHDQTRIATLSGQLEQARAALRQRPPSATPPTAPRSRRTPAHGTARGQ